MADLHDVEVAMVNTVIAALFPAGGYLSGAYGASTVAGGVVKIYRAWPESSLLDADLAAGKSHITVFPESGMTRLITKYPPVWVQVGSASPTITATVSGNVVTFAGSPGIGQVIGVQYGSTDALTTAAYRVLATDTLASAVAALAALVAGSSASGAVLTLPGQPFVVAAGVGADQTAIRELRRQTQGTRVTIWTPTPLGRDTIAAALDAAFAGLTDAYGNLTQFIPLADGSSARVRYRAGYTDDKPAKDRVWRRDLCFTVEYATTQTATQPVTLFAPTMNVTATNPLGATLGTFTA